MKTFAYLALAGCVSAIKLDSINYGGDATRDLIEDPAYFIGALVGAELTSMPWEEYYGSTVHSGPMKYFDICRLVTWHA